ncbi:MAG: DUF262 domain-containing protein [Acidobacteriota bacterium]|nr:DUF262 domain-containing protein [Acidobacteriota bacterium]
MQISTILDQIDLGAMALPEFQRGYVWNRDQVRKLMFSLYRKHPVGSLLVWVTKTENTSTRGDGNLTPGSVKLILDGQQRITSLYGIIRGQQPKFFEGDAKAFTGLYFNLDDEIFEFYAPLKMKDNPLWVNVTDLMKSGSGELIGQIAQNPEFSANLSKYINRLNSVDNIKQIDLHIEEVTGEDKTIDVVVDIFNDVNSGGTKLSKGDLALAKVCAEWSDARAEMKTRLNKWKQAGYNFKLEWLMRCVNSIVTGEALFSHLSDVDIEDFKNGVNKSEKSIDYLLNLISSRLGLDHERVLGSRYSFPLLARYLDKNGGKLTDAKERDKLLYWYIHTFLWGRYAGSTESVLSQDLRAIENTENPLDRLISLLSQNRGDLRLRESDFLVWSKGARFYPLLYMLTRTGHAKDWNTGLELSNHLLGRLSRLEVHHIFPKALLYKYDYPRQDVNALANFTFLTQETNLYVTDKNPSEYLEEFAAKNPGAIESHWIPMDRNLWKVENYNDFLAARRELLADAANKFLDGLLAGSIPEPTVTTEVLERTATQIGGGITNENEENLLIEYNEWVVGQGLPEGEFLYEIIDENTGDLTAIIDLAWANGLQEGLSQPVALLIDEEKEIEEAVNRAGFKFFTNFEDFKAYVKTDILAETTI